MCQARYSFGYVQFVDLLAAYGHLTLRSYYGVSIPSVFNLCSMTGFSILNCILGGQTLASITDGRLSWRYAIFVIIDEYTLISTFSVGIVVITVISLLVRILGPRSASS